MRTTSSIQKCLLDTYKQMDFSNCNPVPYKSLRCGPSSKYYSVFNDGIQKFSMGLNGVMICTIDEDLKIINVGINQNPRWMYGFNQIIITNP